MDCIADGLRQLRAAASQRRDTAAAEVDAIDDLLAQIDADSELADLVPVTVVMQRLGVGRTTVYDLIAERRLPARRIGRAVRVQLDADEAIQRHGDAAVATGARPHREPPVHARPVPARLWHRR